MKLLLSTLASLLLSVVAIAQEAAPSQVLFKNVNIFDGRSDKLIKGRDVLVEDNLIKEIGRKVDAAETATIIDAGGRTLMPGFIEAHAHLMLMGPSLPAMEAATTWVSNIRCTAL